MRRRVVSAVEEEEGEEEEEEVGAVVEAVQVKSFNLLTTNRILYFLIYWWSVDLTISAIS